MHLFDLLEYLFGRTEFDNQLLAFSVVAVEIGIHALYSRLADLLPAPHRPQTSTRREICTIAYSVFAAFHWTHVGHPLLIMCSAKHEEGTIALRRAAAVEIFKYGVVGMGLLVMVGIACRC
ncbi:hypothetical protein LTR95_004636 [Oleoguttula sp. CCFEE 5521]